MQKKLIVSLIFCSLSLYGAQERGDGFVTPPPALRPGFCSPVRRITHSPVQAVAADNAATVQNLEGRFAAVDNADHARQVINLLNTVDPNLNDRVDQARQALRTRVINSNQGQTNPNSGQVVPRRTMPR